MPILGRALEQSEMHSESTEGYADEAGMGKGKM